MKKIGITGHTRGIGKALWERLDQENYECKGFSQSTGYNLMRSSTIKKVVNELVEWDADVLVNNAYVPDNQVRLMYSMYEQWEHKPKLIFAGGSAVPRQIDFKRFREIADMIGAYLHVDMAHFAGLVAADEHPSPFPYADVATTTTHKTLRGPRGGMILCNDEALSKKFNSAIFPGIQGGPLMHVIAAKAVAFGEALKPEFKLYQKQVRSNAVALAEELMKGGLDIVTGGTDTHVMLVDLRPKGVKGNQADKALGRAHITANKNGIPFDPEKPTVTSGLRLGTPAGTTRGFKEEEFKTIARWIVEVVEGLSSNGEENNSSVEEKVKIEVEDLCAKFPIYDCY